MKSNLIVTKGAAERSNKPLVLLLHFTAAAQFCYGVYYDFSYVKFPASSGMHIPFGGKFKYLTIWDVIIQSVYFSICLINDVVGTNEVSPKKTPIIRRVKDYILATLAFPLALHVGISFWALYGIDRELVLPKAVDAVYPNWLNHIMHTNIVVFMLLEMFTSFRAYPKRSSGITGLVAFMLIYIIWLHIIKYYSGFWVYPVLAVLQLPQRLVLFVVSLALIVGLYLFGEYMNNIVWAKELKMINRKVK